MSDRWTDFDHDEEAFLRQFGTSAEELRNRGRNCPPPELLLAADADDFPATRRAEILAHQQSCAVCSALLRDLSDPELAEPSVDEAVRIRSRVLGAQNVPPAHAWRERPLLAIAAIVSLALIGFLLRYLPTSVTSKEERRAIQSKPAATSPRETVFRPEKAPLELPASLLAVRGETAGPVADLGRAFAAYRDDQFSAAAEQFEKIVRDDPSVHAYFYLGVSQLLVGREREAAGNLTRASELDRGSLSDDITWYRSVAQVKSGNFEDALGELKRLCAKPGEYAARACAGVGELEARQ